MENGERVIVLKGMDVLLGTFLCYDYELDSCRVRIDGLDTWNYVDENNIFTIKEKSKVLEILNEKMDKEFYNYMQARNDFIYSVNKLIEE